MPRHLLFTAAPLLAAWLGGLAPRTARAADDFVFHHENVMGTSLELCVRADSPEAARRAEGRVLREINRLSAVFSGYDPASEFSRWQSDPKGPAVVSPELFEVLVASDRWRAATGGAFDPRAEALSRLWARAAKADRTPTPAERAGARSLMAGDAWRLDPVSHTARRLTDCPLTLNAIAKGFIVEKACDAALDRADGVCGLLLNVGGDLRVCGEVARTVGVVDPNADSESSEPLTRIEVKDRSVASSGRSQRGFRVTGRWYSHVFDPRTGEPAAATVAATVVAPRGADADALATAFHVLPAGESLAVAAAVPGVECLLVSADGRVTRSAGWGRLERSAPVALARADDKAPGGSWGDTFEMAVSFEINRPEGGGGRYRRPYVVVWVEDKDGFPVRTVSLWVSQGGAGPFQWVLDLKRWYKSDKARKKVDPQELVLTMSRPTRPPGQYTVVWDGKDDRGKPVAAGEYTVLIDAAREHGTYQGIRKQVTLGDRPFAEELKGNVEIKSAAIEYRRKGQGK